MVVAVASLGSRGGCGKGARNGQSYQTGRYRLLEAGHDLFLSPDVQRVTGITLLKRGSFMEEKQE